MDMINLLFITTYIGLAIYVFESLVERFRGYRLISEAKNTLNNLWSYSEDKFFRAILKDKKIILKEKNRKKMEREMKPSIIYNTLRLALEDLETKGESSKIFSCLEEMSKEVIRHLKDENP